MEPGRALTIMLAADATPHTITVIDKKGAGAEAITYTANLDGHAILLKELKAIHVDRLQQQLFVETVLTEGMGTCADPKFNISCFKGIIVGDATGFKPATSPGLIYTYKGDRIHLLYELINGDTLTTVLATLTNEEKLKYIKQLFHIVKNLHARDILHLDINPNNLMVTREGNLMIIDFGSACLVSKCSNYAGGTFPYMSPEASIKHLAASKPAAIDVFAAGMTMFNILTDRDCIAGTDCKGLLTAKGLSDEFIELFEKMISRAAARPTLDTIIDTISMLEESDLIFKKAGAGGSRSSGRTRRHKRNKLRRSKTKRRQRT